jgi:hypothetical protein
MPWTPHNYVLPANEVTHPTPEPHQDEAAALARTDRSPAAAFVAVALALVGLGLLWFGHRLLLEALCLAIAAIVVAALAWRSARHSRRPGGVALAAFVVGLVTIAVVVLVWL